MNCGKVFVSPSEHLFYTGILQILTLLYERNGGMIDVRLKKWESVLQHDPALQERLQRLNDQGYPATIHGDLLCLAVKDKPPIVVSWDGTQIRVSTREPQKPFLLWSLTQEQFNELFLSGKTPPILVAMNNNQHNIKAGADHHNGSLVVSFMVMLQECMEGGGNT